MKRGGNLWRPSHARDGWSSLAPFVASRSEGTITRDKSAQEKTNDAMIGAENSTSEAKSQELLYAARFSLHRTEMQVEDKMVNFSPGMAVTVEIKTGERTVMSYLLSPLLRYNRRRCGSGEIPRPAKQRGERSRFGWTLGSPRGHSIYRDKTSYIETSRFSPLTPPPAAPISPQF